MHAVSNLKLLKYNAYYHMFVCDLVKFFTDCENKRVKMTQFLNTSLKASIHILTKKLYLMC